MAMHSEQVTFWCGFSSRGHFFFENEKGMAVTVNGKRFQNFCTQKLKRRTLATFGFNNTCHTEEATSSFAPFYKKS